MKYLHCLILVATFATLTGDLAGWVVPDRKPAVEQDLFMPKYTTNKVGMKFVWIPSGTFMMGSHVEIKTRYANETQHEVSLTRGFYLGVYTVTQEEWHAVMGNNPSEYRGEKKLPVEKVSWDDCQVFIQKLREEDRKPYRLPSEAEWEYACRAGTTTPYYFGETISFDRNGKTPAGRRAANPWGVHDMHGYVWQWCQDWYGEYPTKGVVDPQGPKVGEYRVMRGGSWFNSPVHCRSASRHWNVPSSYSSDLGFRVCFFVE